LSSKDELRRDLNDTWLVVGVLNHPEGAGIRLIATGIVEVRCV
jgi:hypothetical protein